MATEDRYGIRVDEDLPPAVPRACKECPWRRDSEPGWLGPYDAKTWILAVHSDQPIACHETIKSSDQPWSEVKQCRGSAIYRANVYKSPRNPQVVVGPQDTKTVFDSDGDFIAHHEQVRAALNSFTVARLREEAFFMPDRHRAKKADIITWLLTHKFPTVRLLVKEAEANRASR